MHVYVHRVCLFWHLHMHRARHSPTGPVATQRSSANTTVTALSTFILLPLLRLIPVIHVPGYIVIGCLFQISCDCFRPAIRTRACHTLIAACRHRDHSLAPFVCPCHMSKDIRVSDILIISNLYSASYSRGSLDIS